MDMKAFEDCIMERVKMDLIPQKFTSDWSTFSHKNASHAHELSATKIEHSHWLTGHSTHL